MTDESKKSMNINVTQILRWMVPLLLGILTFLAQDLKQTGEKNSKTLASISLRLESLNFINQRIGQLEEDVDNLEERLRKLERVRP